MIKVMNSVIRGGKPFSKRILLSAPGIQAAIDDDLLNVSYRVLQFETVFFRFYGERNSRSF